MKKYLIALLLTVPVPGALAGSEAYERYLHGLLAERKGDLATALADYQQASEMDPQALEVYRDLAQLNLRTGHTEAALHAAQRVRDLAPAESSSFLFLGHVYVARGDLALAAQEYEKALKVDPTNLKALENLANYYSAINPGKALEYYQRYLKIDPRDPEIYFQMGFLHQKQGDIAKTVAAFKKSIELDPQQVASHLALAELYELQKSTAAAIQQYQACVQLDPRNPAFYSRLGHLYFENHKWDEAAEQFESARKLEPQDATNFYYLARIAEEREQWVSAGQLVEEAYRLSHDAQFLPLLAYYLTMQHRTRDAITWLEKARESDPKNANVLLFLGMDYIELDKPAKAREILELGVQAHPADPQLHFQLGIAYDRLRRFDDAVKEFQTVLKLDSRNAAAMNYLGYSYAERGINLPEAEAYVSRALKLDPDNGAYWDSLGWIRYKLKRYAEAAEDLERAVSYSQDSLIFEHLGDAYAASNRPEKALGAWAKALALSPKNRAVQKKIEEASSHVTYDTQRHNFLKYIEGNFRQISDLRGLVSVTGRWNKARLKTRGGVYYLRPDRFLLAVGAPTPSARVAVRGQNVQVHPEASFSEWGGFGQGGLSWLPNFFSGRLLAALEQPGVRVTQENKLVHYAGPSEEAWIDPSRGVLIRYIWQDPKGGRDQLSVNSYALVEGLWLPQEMRLTNDTQKSQATLLFSDWKINEPQNARAFDYLNSSATPARQP
jgi:tetratricopeptide (TPR) repeat protein